MVYVTVRQKQKQVKKTWLDLLDNLPKMNDMITGGSAATITREVEEVPQELLEKINVPNMIATLKRFNRKYWALHQTENKNTLYHHFTIPKKTGGTRPIDAPNEELGQALGELSKILTESIGLMYHTSSFAYVKKRSTVQDVRKHQVNNSNWFLKTDFSGFFPSTTLDFVMRMMEMIFPANEICKVPEGKEELRKALSLGFLNGGLPQGTKLSPTLTGIMMIPIDYELFNTLTKRKFVYTRYADDIHISAKEHFPHQMVVNIIRETLSKFCAPFNLKPEKTHYGSKKGKNWILGLMLNGENNITVGWRKKSEFKGWTSNLIMDWKHGKVWSIDDLNKYTGMLSYYKMVEKDYFNNLIEKYNRKYNVELKNIIKDIYRNSMKSSAYDISWDTL